MTDYVITCPTCGKEIGFTDKKKEIKYKDCCRINSKPLLGDKKEKTSYLPNKSKYMSRIKREHILKQIYPVYQHVMSLYLKTRDFVGTYRTFGRILNDLEKNELIERVIDKKLTYVRLKR